jgi:hypothetical protein
MLMLAFCLPVSAQTAGEPVVRPQLLNVTRVESWSFFEPVTDPADHAYTMLSNRARLGIRVDARRVAFEGSFQYAQLVGLPNQGFGPGPLGPGALYFAAAGAPEAYQLYFRSMSMRLKDVAPDLSIEFGRMSYQSGERTPFAGRLIGTVEWTPFERAFDGLRVDYIRPSWRMHGSFVMPTQGAFEESASPTIGKVQLATAGAGTDRLAIFVHNYRDTRAVSARPDNTGIAADAVDINLQTIGGSVSVRGLQAWGAVQRGRWYGDAHRAWSGSIDSGYEWGSATWRPAVRAGVMYATGDPDPNDRSHGTFFPMVPTTRPDILAGTFAQMNVRDFYGTVTIRPHRQWQLAGDVHYLSLAERQDRWYSGTGATAFAGEYFGYSSRRSTLRESLGTMVQVSATSVVNTCWTLKASAAFMRGGDVVRRQFAGTTLWVMTLESVLSLP